MNPFKHGKTFVFNQRLENLHVPSSVLMNSSVSHGACRDDKAGDDGPVL